MFLFARREFDSILDGIVYASIVALGFAASEDVLYYFSSFAEEGLAGLFLLVILRFVIFGWQHAFFTSFTGIGLALARLSRNVPVKVLAILGGLFVAVLFHSLHNSLLTFLNNLVGLTTAAFVAWTGWIAMFFFILWLNYREKAWLTEYLRDEVALATITPEQYRLVCSPFGQSQARLAALTRGRYHITNRFLQLCGELSHKKRQLATLGEENGNRAMIEAIRTELSYVSHSIL